MKASKSITAVSALALACISAQSASSQTPIGTWLQCEGTEYLDGRRGDAFSILFMFTNNALYKYQPEAAILTNLCDLNEYLAKNWSTAPANERPTATRCTVNVNVLRHEHIPANHTKWVLTTDIDRKTASYSDGGGYITRKGVCRPVADPRPSGF